MSIIRIGLAETKHFSEGCALAVFDTKKKKDEEQETPAKETTAKVKKSVKAGKKKGKK